MCKECVGHLHREMVRKYLEVKGHGGKKEEEKKDDGAAGGNRLYNKVRQMKFW